MFMNNKNRKLAVAAATSAIIALTASCGNKQASVNSGSDQFATTEITWADSVQANNCTAKSSLSLEYPSEGNPALIDSTREWIARTLMNVSPIDTAGVDSVPSGTTLSDGETLVAAAGRQFLTEAMSDFNSFDAADGYRFNYTYEAEIGKLFSTDSVVTMTSSTYIYTGGAHGTTLFNAATFRTSDGAILGYDIFEPNSLQELTQMVKDAVATQYFETGDDFKMDDALIIDPQDFRLPSVAPYFTEKGLTFVYQQYEIACYAAGMPSCTIPYSDIAPLLLPSIRPLIP